MAERLPLNFPGVVGVNGASKDFFKRLAKRARNAPIAPASNVPAALVKRSKAELSSIRPFYADSVAADWPRAVATIFQLAATTILLGCREYDGAILVQLPLSAPSSR